MEFELVSVERSADEQHRYDESSVISTSLNQENTSDGQNIGKKSTIDDNSSKLRYSFFLTINNINLIFIYH
jgi:hypothetical protein